MKGGSNRELAYRTSEQNWQRRTLTLISQLLEQLWVCLPEDFVSIRKNLELRTATGNLLSLPNAGGRATNDTEIARVVAVGMIMGEGRGDSRQGEEQLESNHCEMCRMYFVGEGVKLERR